MNIAKNIVDQKFGKLTVIKKAPNIIGKTREYGAWECLCLCGNTKIVATYHLNRGSVNSCGCLYDEFGRSHKPGQKFGRLTTISYKDGKWFCLCDCGEHIEVPTDKLTNGNTKSCGCLKSETASANANKLIEERRQFEPRVASARRVWKNTYYYRDADCVDFENFFSISQQNCFYCGIIPSTEYNYFSTTSSHSSEKGKQEGLFIYNGMDRIDSSKPHTIDNIVPCCPLCNRAKSDRSTEEFLQWISQLCITPFEPITAKNIKFPDSPLSSSIKSIFYGYKKDTDMSVEEFYSISQMNCFYCNDEPNNFFDRGKSDKKASEETKKSGSFYYNGLDRIDRSQPHNKNNIVPCCYYCNFAKSKLALPEFQAWIKRVKEFQENKSVENIKIA
jgi:hypothetical protein